MLPLFPNFKKIELTDYSDIEAMNNKFPPFNDFEFVSLWTYNTDDKNSISNLNENLIIKIQDFLSGKMFYSFMGSNEVEDTINKLIAKSVEENLGNELFLVPETNLINIDDLRNNFTVTEDPNSFDYILSVEDIASLEGKKYYDKRNLVNRFKRLFPNHEIRTLDVSNSLTQEEIKQLFETWKIQKNKNEEETATELVAIQKLFDLTSIIKVLALGIYFNNKLIGFTTYHVLQEKYSIMTFQKGDISFDGIYAYLNHLTAKKLFELGCLYINYEQDLGIEGLKKAKQLWRPVNYLKKYIISEK